MTFLKTVHGGYVNMSFIREIYVRNRLIFFTDDTGHEYTFDGEFADEQSAQEFLDELIEELEED